MNLLFDFGFYGMLAVFLPGLPTSAIRIAFSTSSPIPTGWRCERRFEARQVTCVEIDLPEGALHPDTLRAQGPRPDARRGRSC